jgi:CDP-glycerol glycerophosphotransferase (TagB/SpsB family)
MENSQYENGEYKGLFNYSDAMIHDCGSFIIEYLYTKKPVMYLVEDETVIMDANEQTRQAFAVHYHGEKPSDIEQFIKNVIQGIDSEYEKRDAFFRTHLMPPGNMSVCDNVIRSILGDE